MSSWFFSICCQAVSTAFELPGREKIRVPFAMPAMALDCMVDEPISLKEICLKSSPKPSMVLSNKGSNASGVLSRPVKPVPPVVMITCMLSLAIHCEVVDLIA